METPATYRSSQQAQLVAPRVVIFNRGCDTRVEVVQLPTATDLGEVIRHCGACWRITGSRTHHRVLVAEPV